MLNLAQIKFCARECERQKSGEASVWRMCEALLWLQSRLPAITEEAILLLGAFIEPNKNVRGYRGVPVYFADLSFGLQPRLIQPAMARIIEMQNLLSPDEFYREFQLIHPFQDGNGRVGALLWNYMKHEIQNPKLPYVPVKQEDLTLNY